MPDICPEDRFYKVALSYASENREYVTAVYKALVLLVEKKQLCKKEEIFFDIPNFDEGIVRANKSLKKIYRDQSEFIVPFHCRNYPEKKWTKIEHERIVYIIDNGHKDCIIPIKFDDTQIEGFQDFTDVYISAKDNDAKEVANNICNLLRYKTKRGALLWLRKKWDAKNINYLNIRNYFKKVDEELNINGNEENSRNYQDAISDLFHKVENISDSNYLDYCPPLEEISYTTIIDWLADLDGKEGYEKLLCFIDLFLKEENKKIPQKVLKDITSWLDDACQTRLGIDRKTLNPTPPSFEKEKEKEKEISYLSIELLETDNSNTYRVNFWLHNNDLYRRITSFNIEEVNIKCEDSKQQFTECLMEDLATLRINKEVNSIELEFIVPYELLWTDFEHWINKDGDPLGCEYPVIVKPEEALRNSKAQYLSRWKELNRNNSLNKQLIFLDKKTKPELKNNQDKLQALAIKANKDEQCKGIVIESPLKLECGSIRLFIRHGLPIILWARKGTKENLTETFLRDKSDIENITISQLPNEIRNIRLNQGVKKTKNIEHNIILLIDDKERQLPKKQQLQSPTP